MLPVEFKKRMEVLLGKESETFFAALENEDPVRSFRINEIKISCTDFEMLDPPIDRVPMRFPGNAYYTTEPYPGSLPCHHAGMIYMQDPSAMATACAVKLCKGMKVLDCCAAPGGKSTQLSAMVGAEGILVANEYEFKRARILQSNIERLGCENTVVLNLDTAILAETYPETFDLVVVDAPCSGEGMFRKNSLAISEWTLENVQMCAERQREILANAVQCVVPDGALIYSTCTFSLEENEMNVQWFLDRYPDFTLCDVENDLREATSDGICYEGSRADMSKTRRFYPHKNRGEGQFIALFRRRHEEKTVAAEDAVGKNRIKPLRREKQSSKPKSDPDLAVAEKFLQENLTEQAGAFEKSMVKQGRYIYLKPQIPLPAFGVLAPGVCVGEVIKGRLVPHHQLFSAFGTHFQRKAVLDYRDPRVLDYLRGLELDGVDSTSCSGKKDGWASVIVGGVSIGGGKISLGKCKNHYPKGLRNKQ